MKMFLLKFHRNRTITKNYFSEEGGKGKVGREGIPNSRLHYNLSLVSKHMKMYFKFEKNRTINEQFDFFEGR